MDEDLKGMIIGMSLLAIIIIAILIGSIVNHSKDVELEKYKIQYQVTGEINKEGE